MRDEKILVVDDEIEIGEIIKDFLEIEGYKVFLAFDGEEALKSFNEHSPQLVILDLMLPKIDGMEVCRTIRTHSTVPIIMLSAKREDTDKILGLGFGADDYMTKPFSSGELVARVKSHLRRYTTFSKSISNENEDTYTFDHIQISFKSHSIFVHGENIPFAAKEFQLLKYLILNENRVLTKEQIFNHVWGYNDYGDINTVTVHIRKIREKIEKDPSSPKYIQTVWRVGYKFSRS
ncbi:response regulator transcription factor [Crassaminicella profunda]|uniref:response regulator transcription factor n=1 Tax=Crassaminicella profunda TaxID=1286698 RepID=UPI001CA64CA3|nr:response regulator transcription factor [Crassaminicella profunda]QZY54927.1 response regulator transcription factor [Crassaminicella profunda]